MNGVLTKGDKKYFMNLIDDCTRFCSIYLLMSKDEALQYFKIYKAEKKTNLRERSKELGLIVVESTFLMFSLRSVRNIE
jgi:hypothetical protein